MYVRFWTIAAAPLLALALAGSPAGAQETDADWLEHCRENWGGSGEQHCEVREVRLRAPGRAISVDGRENGAVEVEGWDRDSVAVRARIQTRARSEAEARDLAGRIRIESSGGTIAADGPATGHRQSWSVSYLLFVPRRSDLTVETHNGPIAVAGVSGRMELRAVNGPLVLDGVGGDVHGRTDNGPLNVTLHGRSWEGAGLDAETTNGPVVLTVPDGYSARLETGTVNGPMELDIPVTLQGRINRRRITTTLGSGGAPVRAITTNGPVTIRRQ
jgi:hypothetical protein